MENKKNCQKQTQSCTQKINSFLNKDKAKLDVRMNPARLGKEMETCVSYILDGDWSEKKQEIAIALEEAFVNVCSYAYPDGYRGSIFVHIEKDQSEIRIDVWDEGIPYNPIEAPLKTPNESQIGGHGIRLMKAYSELFYERIANRNHLVLTKQLKET